MFYSLSGGGCYFPEEIFASQQHPVRQMFMISMMAKYARLTDKKPVRMLEVGSYAGQSAVLWTWCMRNFFGAGELVCVDTWESYYGKDTKPPAGKKMKNDSGTRMDQAMESELVMNLFYYNLEIAGGKQNVTTIRGDSRKVLPLLKSESFDIIYIDGNHKYEFSKTDIENARPLVKNGGLLCGDDLQVTWGYNDTDFAEINMGESCIIDPKTNISYHPGVSKAVHESFGELPTYEGFWMVRKKCDELWPGDFDNKESWNLFSLTGERMYKPLFIAPSQKKTYDDYMAKITEEKDADAKRVAGVAKDG